ncbi:MAG: RNA-binding S4 domain-containing protein [Acidobacteriaceae bacterium]|nr:RNA-binding S4 domain-containing protein [Acidobacteriaceae bacterium]
MAQSQDPTRGTSELTRVRIDKWLWGARFFKTRALAVKACELGRIECNGQSVKASREIRVGDRLKVKNDSGEFQVDVVRVADTRGPAKVAQTLYSETEASRQLRAVLAEQRRSMPYLDTLTDGKPSKRDRRVWNRMRGKI